MVEIIWINLYSYWNLTTYNPIKMLMNISQQGGTFLHVGTKLVNILDNDQDEYDSYKIKKILKKGS